MSKKQETKNKKVLPMKLILFACALLVGIIIVVCVQYVGTYNKNRPVLFDENIKSSKISSKNVSKENDGNGNYLVLGNKNSYLNFTINQVSYKSTTSTINGQFSFDYKVLVNENKVSASNVSDVKVYYAAACDWIDYEYTSAAKTVTATNLTETDPTKSLTSTITLKTVLPKHPLLFVSVKEPTIYVKVSYTIKTSDQQISEKVDYYKIPRSVWHGVNVTA